MACIGRYMHWFYFSHQTSLTTPRGHNMKCKNEITQLVPTQWDYKTVKGVCGQTGISGAPIFCDKCIEAGKLKAWQQRQHDLKYNDY